MSASHLGQLAALGTALCWALNGILFTSAGQRVGSDTVNHLRLWIALFCMAALNLALQGEPFPWGAGTRRLWLLGLSGAVGLALGDLFLFEALVLIGTARSLVVMTFAPAAAALLGWMFLGESLRPLDVGAMAITLAGIAIVVRASARPARAGNAASPGADRARLAKGVLFASIGALGQAGGIVLAKPGLDRGFSPVSATLIRIAAATGCTFAVALLQGRIGHHLHALRDRPATLGIAGGTLLGPVAGVTLALFAIQRAPVGIASTLMQLSPVFVLLVSTIVSRVPARAAEWAGTGVAITGAALLFL